MSFPFLPALRPTRCGDPGDEIAAALLINDNQYASAPVAAGSTKRWSLSMWVRRCAVGPNTYGPWEVLWGAVSGSQYDFFSFRADRLCYRAAGQNFETTRLYRDHAGWMHLLLRSDTDNAVANQRLRLTVDGEDVPLASYPAQGFANALGGAGTVRLGYGVDWGWCRANFAEVIYVNDALLDPGEVGYRNREGVWVPRRYAGSYGTVGFRLDFDDPLDLGKDVSGLGNHFVATGLTVANQVTDTPTHTYCTLAANATFGGAVVSDGGLRFAYSTAGAPRAAGSMVIDVATDAVSWQLTPTNTGTPQWYFGLIGERARQAANDYTDVFAIVYTGGAVLDGVWFTPLPAWIPTGARLEIAVIRGAVYLWIDGSPAPADGSPIITGLTGRYRPMVSYSSSGANPVVWQVDFGQRGYQPRPGTRLLCTRDMACPAIKRPERYVTSRLRSGGDGVADLPWSPLTIKTLVLSKRRDSATDWRVADSLRPGRAWATNAASSADFAEADGLTFTAEGYTIGAAAAYQGSRVDYIWRASRAAGFDLLITDHVTGSPTTVPHAVGGIIDHAWVVPVGAGGTPRAYWRAIGFGQYLAVNGSGALVSAAGWFASSAVDLTLAASLPSGRYAVYAWRSVPQFSAFGVYLGNGAVDGAFVPLDFRPAINLVKRTTGTTNHWMVQDGARSPSNPATVAVFPSSAAAEATTGEEIDLVSNGIKIRNSGGNRNAASTLYAYAAWAETPQKFGRGR